MRLLTMLAGPALGPHSPLYWPTVHPTIETGVRTISRAVLELLGD